MATKYPTPDVMLARLAHLTGIPVAHAPLNFPADEKLRANWDKSVGAYVSELTGEPVTCMSLHRASGVVAVHLHRAGESGVRDVYLSAESPAAFARAVWAYESGMRLILDAAMSEAVTA